MLASSGNAKVRSQYPPSRSGHRDLEIGLREIGGGSKPQSGMLCSVPTENIQEAARGPRVLVTAITSWRTAKPFPRNTKKYHVSKAPPSGIHRPHL